MKTPTEARSSENVRVHAAARARALRLLATHALAVRDAYAFHVGVDAVVTIQGEEGALESLVQTWAAEEHPDPADGFREWRATVPFHEASVTVEIVESMS